ncbi:MAG TPA: DUF2304 domain-containing protein [Bryobacteraceae bacterium]|nr:DUF2304 domain-containing protein [Bryobacteraceae bacterium]
MNGVQVILVTLVGGGSLLYFVALRTKLWDRLLVLALALSGTWLILRPNHATSLAHFLGVGRGVDLIIYLALVSLGFVVLLLFSEIRDLESRLVRLSRASAMIQAAAALRAPSQAEEKETHEAAHSA